jgi:hypothetical protein
MFNRLCVSLALLIAVPGWSQVVPAATGPAENPDDEYRMQMPAMVSGKAFPTTTGLDEKSNYLNAGLTFEPSYDDNLLPSFGATPVSGMAYSINPSFEFDQLTPRLHQTWAYNPGFTIYPGLGARNEQDQTASLSIEYRLSRHMTISGQDAMQKSSNVFNLGDSQLGGSVSGDSPSSPADILVPFADRLSNAVNLELSYQFSRDQMVGAGGSYSIMDYLNQAQSSALYNSNSRGGSAFYSRRLFGTQYVGVTYQYQRYLGYPAGGELEVQTHTLFPFYTLSLKNGLSLSLAAGPQYFDLALPPLPAASTWTPAVVASAARQGVRTNLAASYTRSVSGAGGLLGAFSASSANVSVSWKLAGSWSLASTADYTLRKNVSPASISTEPGGHSVSGTFSIQRSLGEHMQGTLGYQRLHQEFSAIAAIAGDPDSDRAYISISYTLSRPMGR